MSDVIQKASTGRSKCRGCARPITAGSFRFGESLPNPYAEGEALFWFHLTCAACMRPEKLRPALEQSSEAVDDREWLLAAALQGESYPKLTRLASAERAPSGRARCRLCAELIEKGVFRLSLQIFEEGRMSPLGSLHVECAEAYFGTADVLERLRHLDPGLSSDDVNELGALLRNQRPAPPGLAKTSGETDLAERKSQG